MGSQNHSWCEKEEEATLDTKTNTSTEAMPQIRYDKMESDTTTNTTAETKPDTNKFDKQAELGTKTNTTAETTPETKKFANNAKTDAKPAIEPAPSPAVQAMFDDMMAMMAKMKWASPP